MYKVYFFLEGADGVDPFRFEGDEARKAILSVVPGLLGYTQTRVLAEQIRPPVPFIGVAELYFDEKTAALQSVDSARVLAPLLHDDVNIGPIIAGRARTVLRLAAHHNGGLIKGVYPFRRKAGVSVAEFQEQWWHGHGPIAARTEAAVLYLQWHPLAETYVDGEPAFDGITELHWPDMSAAKAALTSKQMVEEQGQDSQKFVDKSSVQLVMATEEWVIPA